METAVLIAAGAFLAWAAVGGFAAGARARAAESVTAEVRAQAEARSRELETLRAELDRERAARVAAETRLDEARSALDAEKALLSAAQEKLADSFKALSVEALKNNNRLFLDLAKETLESQLAAARGDLGKRQEAIEGMVRPIKEALERYEAGIRSLEQIRQEAYGGLKQHLEELTVTHRQLQKETARLVQALHTPQVRGRWGEITLRRVVEVAGMSRYCDFEEQPSVSTEDDGRLRPDLTVRLPGGRTVVIDAKVPLASYLEAVEATDEAARQAALARHARAVKEHMRALSTKSYWSQFKSSPDFVILFLPGESFFSAALEQERGLIEYGMDNRVVLATPTTLIALLRTVAHIWKQEQLTENAERIAREGTVLLERLAVFSEHLGRMRDGLSKAVQSYNAAVGSWEGRVMPGVRRLKELGAGNPEKEVHLPEPVDTALRRTGGNAEPMQKAPPDDS